MIPLFTPFRGLSLAALCLRMILAFVCGGFVGIEREYKRRPAGFRTHILICMGAAMTTLTSQYLYLEMNYQTDMARLGAQVVAGIGFIGAGSIIVTRRQRVKGLTTAAGLWATAIIGLAIGAGFYEGGIFTAVLILLAELYFSKLGYYVMEYTPERNLYIEYTDSVCLHRVERTLDDAGVRLLSTEIVRNNSIEGHTASAIFLLRLPKGKVIEEILSSVKQIDGVSEVCEL